jgi:hypothetical protein
MSNQSRALVIGLLGPAISGAGFLWMLAASLTLEPERTTFRYFVFDAPHLMIAAGIVAGLISVPVALSVALAEPEDVEFPAFDAEFEDAEEPAYSPDAPEPKPRWAPK